jgi:tRNA(Ile2) C34 agmatinyltransferase TiaS
MTMKVTRLYTHWDAEQAHTVIAFIDELRDQLSEIYGEQIAEMLRAASADDLVEEQQSELDFDDNVEF